MDPPDADEELSKELRLTLAYEHYRSPTHNDSISKIAREYGVPRSTLQDRIHGKTPHAEIVKFRQRLTEGEEKALCNYIQLMESWGWPITIRQLTAMARELLEAKNDIQPVGVNWPAKFLSRHPELKTKFVPPLDKERHGAQDPAIIRQWFELYQRARNSFNIEDQDVWNMDEKGFMMGVIAKMRVVISKANKDATMSQCGNREWVSTIDCISLDGRILPPWIIFKAKAIMKSWAEKLKDMGGQWHLRPSENGWSDNNIGYEWLTQCFQKASNRDDLGQKYRLLILDGHASHITTKVIEFGLANKIVILCLPPHITHILQPLDVGFFAPLASVYKSNIQRASRLGATYSIDKQDFLQHYILARRQVATPTTIISAWKKAGLAPFDPTQVLQNLPSGINGTTALSTEPVQVNINVSYSYRPTTPPET